jgi:RNA polymerase sigma-70 factor (ECF subfamily)
VPDPDSDQAVAARDGEALLLDRLRAGDERAFEALVARHGAAMLAVARMYVKSDAAAADVVQDAWLGVLKGLARFEARSSLRTWIIRIVANIARTRGAREARSVPVSALVAAGDEAAVAADRFRPAGGAFAGHWTSYPRDWHPLPEDSLVRHETTRVVLDEIGRLPGAQQAVIRLRDVEGWTAVEVCAALDLTDGNQRVLLHRARSRVRAALERHLDG